MNLTLKALIAFLTHRIRAVYGS